MKRPAEKWPTYALENLENSLYRLKQLEQKASQAQDAIVLGDSVGALRDLSDVRVMALECADELMRARIGKYKQQEDASRKAPREWNRSTEEKAVQAVEQMMATRRR